MKYTALIACLLVSITTWGQRYVLFNPSCTERFKYSTPYEGENIVYAVQLSDTERIYLEIGQESQNYKPRISGALISCNNPSLNKNIIDQINNSSGTTFYMVRKEGKGRFLVSPILKASYFSYRSDYLEYESKEFAFAHNLYDDANNNNLNTRASATQIFFVGTTNYACRTGYTFSVSDRNGQLSDMTILPEVGIVSNASYQENIRLANINATNFADYLNGVCNGTAGYDDSIGQVQEQDVDFEDGYYKEEQVYTNPTPTTRPSTTSTPTPTTRTTYPTPSNNQPQPGDVVYTRRVTDSTPSYQGEPRRTYTPSVSASATRTRILSSSDYNTDKRLATDVAVERYTAGQVTTQPTYRTTTPSYNTTVYRDTRPQPEVYNSRGTSRTLPVYRTDNYRLPPLGASNKNYGKVNVRTTSGNVHIVQKRETAYSIAKAYGITLEQLGRCNNLSSFILKPGQQLRIRGCDDFVSRGTTTIATAPVRTTTTTPTTVVTRPVNTTPDNRYGTPAWQTTNGVHVVQAGETIHSIAKLYGYTPARFMDLNGLSANTAIYPGQRLVTSDCSARPNTTTTSTGTTATTTSTQSNAVRTNYFENDMQEKSGYVPNPAPYDYQSQSNNYTRSGSQTHRVRARETLHSIARQYGIGIDELKRLNNMEVAETVIPGQVIFVR